MFKAVDSKTANSTNKMSKLEIAGVCIGLIMLSFGQVLFVIALNKESTNFKGLHETHIQEQERCDCCGSQDK